MKYIVLIIGLLAMGCGKTEEDKVVGTYEHKKGGYTFKWVFLENGIIETTAFAKTDGGTWKMVGNEVHVAEEGKSIAVFKIEPNGDLTVIADIFNGKRDDYPKEDQRTCKRLKE